MCSTVYHKKKSSWHATDNFCESSKQQWLNSLKILIILIFYIIHSLYYDTIVTVSTNKMLTLCYNYNNALMYTLVHVLGPTGSPSRSEKLYKQ